MLVLEFEGTVFKQLCMIVFSGRYAELQLFGAFNVILGLKH